jgi:hypothetical protein
MAFWTVCLPWAVFLNICWGWVTWVAMTSSLPVEWVIMRECESRWVMYESRENQAKGNRTVRTHTAPRNYRPDESLIWLITQYTNSTKETRDSSVSHVVEAVTSSLLIVFENIGRKQIIRIMRICRRIVGWLCRLSPLGLLWWHVHIGIAPVGSTTAASTGCFPSTAAAAWSTLILIIRPRSTLILNQKILI